MRRVNRLITNPVLGTVAWAVPPLAIVHHRARKRSTGQEVAIRVLRSLPANLRATPEEKAKGLLRSMTVWAELGHPHIVRLLDFGRWDDDAVFAVFQLVSGSSLADLLRREG